MDIEQNTTYKQIFTEPVSGCIPWVDIEELLLSLGTRISKGNASRIRVLLNEKRAVFHKPDQEINANKIVVKGTRKLLKEAGFRY